MENQDDVQSLTSEQRFEAQFSELMQSYLVPQYQAATVARDTGECQLIKVAFPKVLLSDKKKLCHCHGNLCY